MHTILVFVPDMTLPRRTLQTADPRVTKVKDLDEKQNLVVR